MKVRGTMAAWVVVGLAALAAPQWASAQDSGPGPVPPAVASLYDASLIRLFSSLDATFVFSAEVEENGPGIFTTGEFEAVVEGQLLLGTWQAVDVGTFAVWSATASGESSTLIVSGFATPEILIGTAFTNVESASVLRYLLIAEAGIMEPMPE
jgi:hypothetical protein